MGALYASIERSHQWFVIEINECTRSLQTSPQSCFEGTYRVPTRLIHDLGSCKKCTKGHFCNWGSNWLLGLEAPRPCTNGTFQNRMGRKSESDCKACPANHYCPTVATVTPLKCPEASSSQAGAARCTKTSGTKACVHAMHPLCACDI